MTNLGLALGGGGALGAAHVGVLQVLKERGIAPTIVAGTSAGAVIGAGYAAGRDPYHMEQLVLDADWENFGSFTLTPRLGLLDSEALRHSIDALGGDANIEDLPLTFGAVATNVHDRTATILRTGSVARALSASIAVPGIFAPVTIDGTTLADGGLVQNLPLQAALDMGAAHVIGVRLAPEWDALPQFRTSAQVHALEISPRVTLIRPHLGPRSPWIKKDLPGIIAAGRAAAESSLADYPVVDPRPAG